MDLLPLIANAMEKTATNIHGCHCFKLCTPTDWAHLMVSLPPRKGSYLPRVWREYLSTVYGGIDGNMDDRMLLARLHTLELLYPRLLPTQTCDYRSAPAVPRCLPSLCAQWLHTPTIDAIAAAIAMRANRTFAMSTDGQGGRVEWVLSQQPIHARTAAASNTWIEVIRRQTDHKLDPQGRFLFPEGAAAYGCWFLRARGSGIFVSTGSKTLAVATTWDAVHRGYGHIERDGLVWRQPIDLCFAKVSARRGHSTFQIVAGNDQPYGQRNERRFKLASVPSSELVVSHDAGCMHGAQPLAGGCVPVDLRTGLHAERLCHCNDSRFDFVNCDEQWQHVERALQLELKRLPPRPNVGRLEEPKCSDGGGRVRGLLLDRNQRLHRLRSDRAQRRTQRPAPTPVAVT